MFYCELNTKLADGPRDIEGPHAVGFWQVNITNHYMNRWWASLLTNISMAKRKTAVTPVR